MSRSHMLYENDTLSTLPVKFTNWKNDWNPEDVFRCKSGVGLIVEGVVMGKSRHTIVDGVNSNLKFRYVTYHVKLTKAVRRKFDLNGKEVEPDFGSSKKANTGYLLSSYKTVSKDGEDVISLEKATEMLQVNVLDGLNREKINSLNTSNVVFIWCEEKDMEGTEIEDKSSVRLRTKGDGPFLESAVCLDSEKLTKVNYSTGESVGGSWTDKVLNVKEDKSPDAHLTEDSSAVNDDEWDD